MNTSVAVDPANLARAYAADPDAWPTAPRFDADQRWYSRLHADTGHEAWLLTWLPGQGTEIHDHGGARGAFLVLSGRITEDVYGPREEPRHLVAEYGEGHLRRFGDHHIHRVHNAGTEPAVTLHVYAPGLSAMSQYSFTAGRLDLVRTERAGVDW